LAQCGHTQLVHVVQRGARGAPRAGRRRAPAGHFHDTSTRTVLKVKVEITK
jgi:hypothetical protein